MLMCFDMGVHSSNWFTTTRKNGFSGGPFMTTFSINVERLLQNFVCVSGLRWPSRRVHTNTWLTQPAVMVDERTIVVSLFSLLSSIVVMDIVSCRYYLSWSMKMETVFDRYGSKSLHWKISFKMLVNEVGTQQNIGWEAFSDSKSDFWGDIFPIDKQWNNSVQF